MAGRRALIAVLAFAGALLACTSAASAREVLYAAGAQGDGGSPSILYRLDPATGAALETIGPIGFNVTGLAIDPADGTMYGSTGRATSGGTTNPGFLITVNRETGSGTLVGDLQPNADTAGDITFTPDGTLYGWIQPIADDLAVIDKQSGAATVVGNSGITTTGSGLASSADGVIYHTALDSGPLWTLDRTTGAATEVATLNGTDSLQINGLSFDAAGTLFGAWLDYGSTGPRPSRLITINTSTGGLTFLGPSVNRLDAIAFGEVQSRRTLSFVVSKVPKAPGAGSRLVKIKKGKKALFAGDVSAPLDVTGCEDSQTVVLERKRPIESGFSTFARLQTDAAGAFSMTQRVKKTYEYRALLGESAACDGATSVTEKVKAKKKKNKKKNKSR